MDSPPESVGPLVEHVFRYAAGRAVAALTGILGSDRLDLAEECVQAAFVRALETWPYRGIPDNPPGWILQVARNGALDRLRREATLGRKLAGLGRGEEGGGESAGASGLDDQAAMILMCCHEEIPAESRIALTLKTVSGFSIPEIARALLVGETAAAQRVVRAKRRIREAGIRFALPRAAELERRLPSALDVLYLMFNEGYAAHGGEDLTRRDLCEEALRLTGILTRCSGTDLPEVHALHALLCFQASRLAARTGSEGELLRLDEQDRGLWDAARIAEGVRHLELAARGPRATAYHLEAGIAACHATARNSQAVDWPRILDLYDELAERSPSPVVLLNRAVAVGRVRGPAAALEALEAISRHPSLDRYYLLPATEGELWEELGEASRAAACYRRAASLPCTEPERRFLRKRLAGLPLAPS
jgi:RNA polymerase sigma-70 factor (ECF subfamily)